MTDIRLGIFLCACGERVSSILDLRAVEQRVKRLANVVSVRQLPYSCSPDGLQAIQKAVVEERLNRIVVAGCTPRTLASKFQSACKEVGLPGHLCDLVDVREGCAWVHRDESAAATEKAIDLVRMGAARLTLCGVPQAASAKVAQRALVLGGGLAGLTSATILANAGVPVTLVEREAHLGGMLCEMHTLFPDGQKASELLAARVRAVNEHPLIEVLLNRNLVAVSGGVGCYTVSIDGAGANEDCHQVSDVGAIIVATGGRMTKPRGLYRYDGKRVVTQLEFERELAQAAQGSVLEHPLSDVVMILCAGQRNDLGPHCTGGCCQLALKQAIEVKAIGRQSNVTIVFRDLNLMGNDEYEGQLAKAREAGVQFVRFASSSPPSLSDSVVEVSDILTGAKLSVPYQKVVLATPMLPQGDAAVVAHMLHLTQDASGFFPEVRNRLRPQRYADRGIYVCGAAHHPTEWRDAEFEATSAAFRALRHLTAGVVSSEADAAVVDEQLCTGCATCTHTCPFDAISMRKREGVLDVAWIDGLLCKGCGNCVVACPVKAISTGLSNDRQVMAQIEAALSGARGAGRSRILIFGCEWSGYAAAQLAGARGLQYAPSVRTIQVPCSARIDPMHILWAFLHGADGVFVGACPPGDCHYQSGNRFAQERIEVLRGLLSYKEFDPRRLRLDWITPDDGPAFVAKIESFVEFIRALGPSAIMETEGEGEAVDVSETA